jgi:hypothetical protein
MHRRGKWKDLYYTTMAEARVLTEGTLRMLAATCLYFGSADASHRGSAHSVEDRLLQYTPACHNRCTTAALHAPTRESANVYFFPSAVRALNKFAIVK